MTAHTIKQVRLVPSINQVIVPTDDPEIGTVAQRYGAEVIWRPVEIVETSGSDAPSEVTLLHVLEYLLHVLEYLGGQRVTN